MSDERADVIGSLPSRRPQRRSPKRGPAAGDDAGVAAETPGSGGPAAKPPAATKRPSTAKPPAATKRPSTAKRTTAAKRTADATPRTAVPPAKGKPAARKPPVNVRTQAGTAPAPAHPDAGGLTAAAGTSGARGSGRTSSSPGRPPVNAPAESPPGTGHALQTVVQAAGELTELGLRAGARALRGVVSRLPRP